MPKLCPNIRFPHQQDFFPIRSVTKSSTSRFSHENLVEKFKIFVQDFVPIRTALTAEIFTTELFFTIYRQKNHRLFFAIAMKSTAQHDFTACRQKALPATFFLPFTV